MDSVLPTGTWSDRAARRGRNSFGTLSQSLDRRQSHSTARRQTSAVGVNTVSESMLYVYLPTRAGSPICRSMFGLRPISLTGHIDRHSEKHCQKEKVYTECKSLCAVWWLLLLFWQREGGRERGRYRYRDREIYTHREI